MIIAHQINAGHDSNGNGRRGWLVYHYSADTDGNYGTIVGFLPECDYSGTYQIVREIPGIVLLGSTDVPVSEYRHAMDLRSTTGQILAKSDAMNGNRDLANPDHAFNDDGSDPGNCAVCHFFHR
jgi:hypothetical protein